MPEDTIRRDLLNSGIYDVPGVAGEPVGEEPLWAEESVSRRSFAMAIV